MLARSMYGPEPVAGTPTVLPLRSGMPRMSYSPESRSSRRVRQETQVEAITARLRRDRTGGHNPADAALACSLRSDKMGVVRVDFRPAAADLQGRRAAPKKPRRTGDFVGIGAVEAASLATGGAVVLQRAMFQFADGDQPNRSDSRMNSDVNLYDGQIGRFSPLRMRPV